jgi:hypothetical protein
MNHRNAWLHFSKILKDWNWCMLTEWAMEGMIEKMATGTQTQTVWAPWIRDLAEMLETLLTEGKHKGELKLWHLEPLALTCYNTLKEQVSRHPHAITACWPTGPPSLLVPCCPAKLPPTSLPNCHPPTGPLACQASPRRHTGTPFACHRRSRTPPERLQTCLGDTDRHDWMLKE